MRRIACVIGMLALTSSVWGAGPRIEIVVGANAPALERMAADDIAAVYARLYQADAKVVAQAGPQSANVVLIGSPQTNSEIRALNDRWPKLSDQGHVVRTVQRQGQTALLVGGGTPVATYWAASELGHQLGVRSMLYSDLDPIDPPKFSLQGFDLVVEPNLRSRTWRTVNDFPIGPESWGLDEQRRVIRQLAKLKFNRLLIAVYPWQPFVHFEFKGTKKQTGFLWFGWKYPLTGEIAGRAAFGGKKFFENPDFAGLESYEQRVEAGKKFLSGIIDAARQHGMSVGILMSPLEFPKEFASVLPDAKSLRGLENLTVGPGRSQKPNDSTLLALVKTQIQAYLTTYAKIDAIYLSLPEFPEWDEHAEESWKRLSTIATARSKGTFPSLEELTKSARNRSLIASQDRGVAALRGNLVSLDFFQNLSADGSVFRRPDGQSVEVQIADLDPALFSVAERVVPTKTGGLHFVDYTARRVVENKSVLANVPAKEMMSSLILTLADDNVGVLPQAAHSSIRELLTELQRLNWSGYSTRYWCVGDLDLSAYLLSRGSFTNSTGTNSLTVDQACRDLVGPFAGEDVADRVLKGLSLVEQATRKIDENDIGFTFPVPNMILKHYGSEVPPPAWWGEVRDHYLNAMNEMYRANTRTRDAPAGRSFTLYLARRCEFGFEYLNCVEAVRKAGIAKRSGNREEQVKQLQAAVDSMGGALNALAAVARSNSDAGIIAVLNEYGYRPLTRELEAAEDAAAKE